jgi:hypothetical protein
VKKLHLNPVYERERIRTDSSALVFPGVPLYAALISAVSLAVFAIVIRQADAAGQNGYEAMLQLYLIIMMAEGMLVTVIAPGLAGTAAAREREREELPVLQSAGIPAFRLMTGKFFSCMDTILLFLAAGIPASFLVYIYGGIPLSAFFESFGVLILTAAFFVSVSLMFSALSQKAWKGAALSYSAALFVTAGTLSIHYLPALLLGTSYGSNPGIPIPWYQYLLLFNPLLTLYGLLNEQTGTRDFVFSLINDQGNYRRNWLTSHWTPLSLGIAAAAAAVCFFIAVKAVYRKKSGR